MQAPPPNYTRYFQGDPTELEIETPAHFTSAAKDIEGNAFLQQLVKVLSKELFRNEHHNILHDSIFVPAIQKFALLLRPWLLLLTSIFLLLLIVGIFQLVVLFTRSSATPKTTPMLRELAIDEKIR